MSDQADRAGRAPEAVGPYTPVVRAGDWLICSGQIPLRAGTMIDGGVKDQTTQCVRNLQAQLETQGATLAQVVKTTVFMTNIEDYDEMNKAYVEAFGHTRPARSAVAVRALPRGANVEIEAWAYIATA